MNRPRLGDLGPIALLVIALAGACTTQQGIGTPTTPSIAPSQAPVTHSPEPSAVPSGYEEVHFPSRDGIVLSGRYFSSGPIAVVLGHMGRSGDAQDDWASAAGAVQAAGYTVLTFNFRGICSTSGDECSDGELAPQLSWQDELGAVDYLSGRGHSPIFAGGASLGAMAALKAILEDGAKINGLIWFAGTFNGTGYRFSHEDEAAVACPKLLMAGDGDGPGKAAVLSFDFWAPEPKTTLYLDSNKHGTDMFALGDPAAEDAVAAIIAFLGNNASASASCAGA